MDGRFHENLDVLLMADCKRISKGNIGECRDDADLWSHEAHMSWLKKVHKKIISEDKGFIEDDLDLYLKLKHILKLSSL